MIRAVIIEDEPHSQQGLAALLEHYCPDVALAGVASNMEQARHILTTANPDLVFLDVELGTESGFDLFKHFPSPPFEIVFTTAHSGYALDAIRFSCLDYLLKPIDFRELQRAVSRMRETTRHLQAQIDNLVHNLQIKGERKHKLAISHVNGYDFIAIDDIVLAKAEGNYTRIFTSEKEIVTTRTLGEFDAMLPSSHFFRTHKSYLINLHHIETFNRSEDIITLAGGHKAELASRKRDAFLKLVRSNTVKISTDR